MYENGEQYFIEKEWKHCGLKCVAIAIPMGHRCGYVGIDEKHPLYNNEFDEGDVHGGVTFSGFQHWGKKEFDSIENDGIWWIGFDCAHYMDAKDFSIMNDENKKFYKKYPFSLGESLGLDCAIRTLDYVVFECEKLAEQLADMIPKEKPISKIKITDNPTWLDRLINLEID